MRDDSYSTEPGKPVGLSANAHEKERVAAHQVPRDMERIFGMADFGAASRSRGGADVVVSLLAPRRKRARAYPTIAVAVAGTLTACAALWLVASQGPIETRIKAAAMPQAIAQRAAQPPKALLASTSVPSPAPPAPSSSELVVQDQPQSAAPRIEPVRRASATTAPPAKRAVARKSPARPARSPVDPACAGLRGSARADCQHAQLVDADQQMRGAYARAIRAGVDPEMLLPYRQDWARLLDQADSDPHRASATLGRMARELDDERRGL